MAKICILDETKICNGCGDCNICDLDKNKICDNCGKCIDADGDYSFIDIEEILVGED